MDHSAGFIPCSPLSGAQSLTHLPDAVHAEMTLVRMEGGSWKRGPRIFPFPIEFSYEAHPGDGHGRRPQFPHDRPPEVRQNDARETNSDHLNKIFLSYFNLVRYLVSLEEKPYAEGDAPTFLFSKKLRPRIGSWHCKVYRFQIFNSKSLLNSINYPLPPIHDLGILFHSKALQYKVTGIDNHIQAAWKWFKLENLLSLSFINASEL